jgi:hypothetical protein
VRYDYAANRGGYDRAYLTSRKARGKLPAYPFGVLRVL